MGISLESFKRNKFLLHSFKIKGIYLFFPINMHKRSRVKSEFSFCLILNFLGNQTVGILVILFLSEYILVILKIFGIWKCIYICENWMTKLKIESKYRD